MISMKQFCRENRIRIESDWADENPNNPEWKDANHYKCLMKRPGKQMTLYFSQGYGITEDPTIEGVLDCLISDASSMQWSESFEDWANDLGYDTDSRKAEKIYKAVTKQTEKLKKFLGDELYDFALENIERL